MKHLYLFLLLVAGVSLLQAQTDQYKIIVSSSKAERDAANVLKKLQAKLDSNSQIAKLQATEGFQAVSRPSGKYHIVSIEPFEDRTALIEVIAIVRQWYPDAFSNKLHKPEPKAAPKPKAAPVPAAATDDVSVQLDAVLAHEAAGVSTSSRTSSASVASAPSEPAAKTETPVKTAAASAKSSISSVTAASSETAKPQPVKTVIIHDTPKAEKEIIYADPHTLIWQIAFWITAAIALTLALLMYFLVRNYQKRLAYATEEFGSELKALKSESKHKKVFLSKINHELRTPLNAVIGLSELVLQSPLNAKQEEYLHRIKYSADLLLSIVNDLLDVNKVETGKLKVASVPFNFNNVLNYISNVVSEAAERKKLELVFDIDHGLPAELIGDPVRLSQVLTNLLENAIKFSDKGTITLHIGKRFQNDQKVQLEFTVSDNGMGMRPEQMENIFKSFNQIDNNVTRKQDGMGLGLTITKQLVELMGGKISVKSTYGEGSRFYFTLTFSLENPGDKRQYRLPSKALMGKKVLVINPYVKTTKALANMLQYFHYHIRIAHDYDEAELMLKGDKFDLIFIEDSLAKDKNALRLAALRKAFPVTTILLETIFQSGREKSVSTKLFDHTLYKPFNQQSVYRLIVKLFEKELSDKERLKHEVETAKKQLHFLKGETVLIAEDNNINQQVIKGMLDHLELNIIFADNGETALSELNAHAKEIKLIIMDISMPVMDGFEAVDAIRKQPRFNPIPIIMISANGKKESGVEEREGIQGYIEKPLSIETFYTQLYHILRYASRNRLTTL